MIRAYVAPGRLPAAVAYCRAAFGRLPKVSNTFTVREWTVAAGGPHTRAQNGTSSPARTPEARAARACVLPAPHDRHGHRCVACRHAAVTALSVALATRISSPPPTRSVGRQRPASTVHAPVAATAPRRGGRGHRAAVLPAGRAPPSPRSPASSSSPRARGGLARSNRITEPPTSRATPPFSSRLSWPRKTMRSLSTRSSGVPSVLGRAFSVQTMSSSTAHSTWCSRPTSWGAPSQSTTAVPTAECTRTNMGPDRAGCTASTLTNTQPSSWTGLPNTFARTKRSLRRPLPWLFASVVAHYGSVSRTAPPAY